ncbi:MAG TPA: PAS domain S-box protein [Thermoguttaceae bacterium]|nr:PAS domain S-box protein [Thermoguttaceae bacterium]
MSDTRRATMLAFGGAVLLVLLAGLFLPVAGSVASTTLAPEWRWDHVPFHSAVEVAGGLFALALAMILLASRTPGNNPHHLWMAAALVGMGVLDIAHAAVAPGETFVWFHSTATCVGGILSALVWLPARISDSPRFRLVLPLTIAAVLAVCVCSLGFPGMTPAMVDEGAFTTTARALNILGGLGFLAAAGWFLKRYRVAQGWDDYLFACLCCLFGAAGVLFELSSLWDAAWWWWHLLRVAAYALAIAYSAIAYQREIAERRQSEAFQRALTESSPDFIFVLGRDGTVLRVNRTHPGHEEEDVVGHDVRCFVPPPYLDAFNSAFSQALETGKMQTVETTIPLPGGERHFLNRLNPVSELMDGGVLVLIATDITDRKQAEEGLHETMERQGALNRLQDALLGRGDPAEKLTKITDGVVETFDADFCRIWITKPGDRCESGCIHASVTDGPHVCRYRDRCLHLMASSGRYTRIDGDVHRRVPFGCYKIGRVASDQDHKFLTNEAATDPRVHNHDWVKELGLVSFAGYQLRPPGGQTIGVLALFSKHAIAPEEDALLESLANTTGQVIQRAQAEEQIRRLATITEQAAEGIAVADLEGNMQFANHAWAAMHGYESGDELVGKHLSIFHTQEQFTTDVIPLNEEVKQRGHNVREVGHMRKDGTVFPAMMTVTLLKDEQGTPYGIAGFMQDVTERKRAEEQLDQYVAALESTNKALEELSEAGRVTSASLAEKLAEVEVFNRLAVGRELRMVELKEEINGLLAEQGKSPNYEIAEAEVTL